MVRRLGLGKTNHLTYASLALNPRYLSTWMIQNRIKITKIPTMINKFVVLTTLYVIRQNSPTYQLGWFHTHTGDIYCFLLLLLFFFCFFLLFFFYIKFSLLSEILRKISSLSHLLCVCFFEQKKKNNVKYNLPEQLYCDCHPTKRRYCNCSESKLSLRKFSIALYQKKMNNAKSYLSELLSSFQAN